MGENAMATYVTLIKFTERGVKDIKDTCKRAADFKFQAKKLGIEARSSIGAWELTTDSSFSTHQTTRQRAQQCFR